MFDPDTQDVLLFLTEEFEKGLSYSTINCTRSALSLIVECDIATDHRIKRFFKGISNIRPARPKYEYTWDPNIIIDHFSRRPSNEELSLKELSKKLITLLAITTGHRMQTFSFIELDNIRILKEKIEIIIPARIKTSKRNASQPIVILPYYTDKKLCVASTLLKYLESTKKNSTFD